MNTKTVMLKGWANNSDFLFNENVKNNMFAENLKNYVESNLKGYNKLSTFDTLKGKQATEKVVIKGKYWRGNWSSPTMEVVAIFYK
jgi:hypothetical protein